MSDIVSTMPEQHLMNGCQVKKVAVLGAGVMGAQIAAHFSNAGFETLLFDLPQEGDEPNLLANKAIKHLQRLKPLPVAFTGMDDLIPANYRDDAAQLEDCDLIIEAISEKLEHKQALFALLEKHLSNDCIVATNTSGLSINTLAALLPERLQGNFCGVHFFNPPRVMKLVELIPGDATTPDLVDQLEALLTSKLGKRVIRAKDTPNFIANRVGVFALLNALHLASKYDIPWDVVDSLTGTAIGRSSSATCRTIDIVGLDTFSLVVKTMADSLPDDPWCSQYQLPEVVSQLISSNALGYKTNGGFYKKEKGVKVWNGDIQAYEESDVELPVEISAILKEKNWNEKLHQLQQSSHVYAQFLWEHVCEVFTYCAYHLPAIARSASDVDLAMRWGFGWQESPFEIWQSCGWSQFTLALSRQRGEDKARQPIPSWVEDIRAVYCDGESYSPSTQSFQSAYGLRCYQRQYQLEYSGGYKPAAKQVIIQETTATKLWRYINNVLVLSFKGKGGVLTATVLDDLAQALDYAEVHDQPLILWQEGNPFSYGADLKTFQALIKSGDYQAVETYLDDFQKLCMRVKYAKVPVIAALEDKVLGGGCELAMHCAERVAAFETYMGLVELGVGLIPAGGGCKELALAAFRNAGPAMQQPWLEKAFDIIGNGRVSSSAVDAQGMGLLADSDTIVMHNAELLYVATVRASALHVIGYQAPKPAPAVAVTGRKGFAMLQARIVNLREGDFISEHDSQCLTALASIFTGGDVDEHSKRNESDFLFLEKKAFLTLMKTEKTQRRIDFMLENRKPLRN